MTPDSLLLFTMASLAALYAGAILILATGTRKSIRRKGKSTEKPFVSVVIPARNEGANIERCIASVLACDYADYEVLVVDDGSTDGTADIVQSLADVRSTVTPQIKLIRAGTGSPGAGKVNAIKRGIAESSGEVIVTLDADCVVRSGWLRSMVGCMEKDVGFVAGPVAYRESRSLLRRLEALEFMSLIGVGAGAIGLGRPIICNSANAAYRRELYDRMPESVTAVDFAAADELLMLYVHQSSEYGVSFCSRVEALVETAGAHSVAHFLRQRMRWVSIVQHLPLMHSLALVLAFAFFVLMMVGLAGAPWNPKLGGVALVILVLKGLVDYQVLSPVCRHFGRAFLLPVLPLAELLYLPYVLIAAPAGVLRQPVWKGRAQARQDPALSHASSAALDGET